MPNWAIGFTMGLLTVLAWQRLYSEPVIIDGEAARAEELINVYQRGKADALRVNGGDISMELEQACLTLWANRQQVK
jgi:hypothetical protein